MFILTDGKNYVMENPMRQGDYLSTTSPTAAKQFTYKKANSLRQSKGKRLSWIRNYQLVDVNTGEKSNVSPKYRGNAGCFIGENDIEFDENTLDEIMNETNSILRLAGWNSVQLSTYKNIFTAALSKYDSAESDIVHALQKYKEDNDGKKPQAHKMAKIAYLLDDIRDKHKKIKQCMDYIQVMQDAVEYKYSIEKIKLELVSAKHSEYKGRTEFYKIAMDILE